MDLGVFPSTLIGLPCHAQMIREAMETYTAMILKLICRILYNIPGGNWNSSYNLNLFV
jgi:hypothetical protein